MSDPNLFAVLTPYDDSNFARDAFGLIANVDLYRKAAEGIAEEPTIDSREPTPAPPSSPMAQREFGDRILLCLNKLPKDPKTGWQFGTNPRISDVLLGHRGTLGISSRQFYIAITEEFRVELHETSRHGTVISYDNQGKDVVVKDDKRLLSFEPGAQKQWNEIIVYVPDAKGLAFKIDFPSHRVGASKYRENLRALLEECQTALPSVGGLGLESNPFTASLSRQTQTPSPRSVCFDDGEIGRGEFGLVYKFIDMRVGQFYAAKKFKSLALKRRNGKRMKLDNSWIDKIRVEVDIMTKNPHVSGPSLLACRRGLILWKPNIMQVIGFEEKPEPLLLMPYYPLGNLEDRKDVESSQYVSAFRQILLGLRHLHGRGVAHRDLKPANLLIANRHPFTVVISDFGLSRSVARNELMKTFCGSRPYAAPDIVIVGNKNCHEGYGHLVDIWSAGVIMLEFIFGRPDHTRIDHLPTEDWIKAFSKIVVKTVAELDENNDQVIDILKNMLTIKPMARFTAEVCLQKGCDNGLFKRLSNGRIIDGGEYLGADASEVDSDAETGIASPGTTPADKNGSENGTPTPR